MMVLTQTRRQQLATAVVLLIAIASYMFVSPAKLVYCMRDAVAVPGSPIKSDVPTALPIPGIVNPQLQEDSTKTAKASL
jgi:hypothetical protein